MVSWPPPLPKTKEIVINFGKRGSVQAPVSISGAKVQMVENFQVPVSKHHQRFVLYQPYCSDSPESTPLQHLRRPRIHRCIIETICLCASQLRRGLLCPRPQKITKSCNHNTVHRTKQPPSPPLSTPCTLRAASGKQPTLSRTIFTPVIPFAFLSSREKDTKASKHQNQEQLLLHCSQTTEQSTYKLWPPISQTTSWNPGTFVPCTFSVTVTLYSALFHFSLHFLFDLYFGTRGNNKQIQVSKIMYELLIWNLHRKTSCFVPRSQ